jgi:hypothetical protein
MRGFAKGIVRRVSPTSAEDDPDRAKNRLAPALRVALLGGGVALVALAAILWWPAPPATVQSRTETTVSTTDTSTPKSRARRWHTTPATRTQTTTKTTVTSQIVDGRPDQASEAQPAGSPTRRSEAITVALLAGALLLWLLAAVGRVPSKVSVGAASAEWAPPLTPKEAETLATKVTEKAKERGINDPKEVGSAYSRAYTEALEAKRQQARVPAAETIAWGAEFVDTYFDKLADKAVSEEAGE